MATSKLPSATWLYCRGGGGGGGATYAPSETAGSGSGGVSVSAISRRFAGEMAAVSEGSSSGPGKQMHWPRHEVRASSQFERAGRPPAACTPSPLCCPGSSSRLSCRSTSRPELWPPTLEPSIGRLALPPPPRLPAVVETGACGSMPISSGKTNGGGGTPAGATCSIAFAQLTGASSGQSKTNPRSAKKGSYAVALQGGAPWQSSQDRAGAS